MDLLILKYVNGAYFWGFENNIKERYQVILIKTVRLILKLERWFKKGDKINRIKNIYWIDWKIQK